MLFQYTHLSSSEIRLVRVLPYSTSENIFLSLEHQSLSRPSDYTVLLHSGDAEQRKPVTLSGRAYMAPASAVQALGRVWESERRHERFWIEEICVCQSDEDEKRSQAKMMPEITAGAREVLVWLDGKTQEDFREGGLDAETVAPLLSISFEVLKQAKSLRMLSALATDADAVEGAIERSKV